MITAISETVTDPSVRKVLYRALYDCLTSRDWDCTYEVEGIDPLFDEILEYEHEKFEREWNERHG